MGWNGLAWVEVAVKHILEVSPGVLYLFVAALVSQSLSKPTD